MATVIQPRPEPMSVPEFLAWESEQELRHELINGHVRMMTGGTVGHNLVGRRLARVIEDRLAGRNCVVLGSDVKIVTPDDLVTYPDVLVSCGRIDERADQLTDPMLVAEILSPSTSGKDLVVKRQAYLAIPSLRHLLYIKPLAPYVEVCTREDDRSWRSVIHGELDALIRLQALDIEFRLGELYVGLEAGEGAGKGDATASR